MTGPDPTRAPAPPRPAPEPTPTPTTSPPATPVGPLTSTTRSTPPPATHQTTPIDPLPPTTRTTPPDASPAGDGRILGADAPLGFRAASGTRAAREGPAAPGPAPGPAEATAGGTAEATAEVAVTALARRGPEPERPAGRRPPAATAPPATAPTDPGAVRAASPGRSSPRPAADPAGQGVRVTWAQPEDLIGHELRQADEDGRDPGPARRAW
ncbi:hypothetical protein ACFW82_39370, partial [Streptomyces sp. NPDC058728]